MSGRKVFVSLILGLAVGQAASAGMIPVSLNDAPEVCPATGLQSANTPLPFDSSDLSNRDGGLGALLPDIATDVKQDRAKQHSQALTEGTDSLSLCLSALIGLGLCGSFHHLKKLHFGFIPDWYHDGGPLQIGHSHAVNPNTLCTVPAYCFIQPGCTSQNVVAQYRLGTIVSLWRISQFTPKVLGSRAPPVIS